MLVLIVGIGAAVLTIYTAIARKYTGAYLCDDCRFNDPEKCLKVERPFALVCTSYRTADEPPSDIIGGETIADVSDTPVALNAAEVVGVLETGITIIETPVQVEIPIDSTTEGTGAASQESLAPKASGETPGSQATSQDPDIPKS